MWQLRGLLAVAAVAQIISPQPQCVAEFEHLCCDDLAPSTSCSTCVGKHQHQLRAAGCQAEDVMRLCPAVVVLDECTDSFGLYYLASDAAAEAAAVAIYERSSGNLTLATCKVGGQDDACRARSDWRKVQLKPMYDNFVSAIGVAVLPGGSVFVVWVSGFPAKVAGVLCGDVRCLSPKPIEIYGDDWDGAGGSVSVAASGDTIAIAFAAGFQNKAGVSLATVVTSRLGKSPFAIQQIYAGQVGGPVSVAVSGPRVSVTFMGARCQNVSVSTCANASSSCAAIAKTTLTVATALQEADPTSFSVLQPDLTLRGQDALLVWPSLDGGVFSRSGLNVAALGGAVSVSSSNVANGTTKASIAGGGGGGQHTASAAAGAVLAFSTDYQPDPPYTSLRVGKCADIRCSSVRAVRVVESGVLASDLTLSVVPGSAGGARVLSFSSNCGINRSSSPIVRTICVKVALWDL